jgi:hypothetical protein
MQNSGDFAFAKENDKALCLISLTGPKGKRLIEVLIASSHGV